MQVLFYCFAVVCLVNLCYYFGFLKFSQKKPSQQSLSRPLPVSVIICAKNEAENLRNFLPSILSQNHPHFEVVVINDASTDETLEVIEDFQARDPRVKIVNVQNNEAFWANKKYALTLGIKKAVNPYLLFTDADCQPESENWISEMTAGFRQDKSIILGYGGYFVKKRSLLNKLIRFETLLTAVQYFSYANWGLPYMGVGRNLAYTAEEFYNQNGFASHLHLRSGDDDLFVNQASTAKNTVGCFTEGSVTRSVPKENLRAWFHQKKRHVSVAKHYKLSHRILLGLFYLSQITFWALFIILLFSSFWKLALGALLLRLLVQGIVFYNSGKKLNEKDLIWLFPFLELFLVSAQLGIFISNSISKPNHWK